MYQENAVIVYQLLPTSVKQDVVAYDFLEHLQGARAQQELPETGAHPKREVREIRMDRRLVMVTRAPSDLEYTVKIPPHARLSFAVGKENSSCAEKASFQVWISLPGKDAHLLYNCSLEGENTGWTAHQVDLAAYATKTVLIGFATADLSNCSEYYWADPVMICSSSDLEDASNFSYPSQKPGPKLSASGDRN
jgi:hypothetical protein